MIPPFDATATKIGSGRIQAGAPVAASTTNAQSGRELDGDGGAQHLPRRPPVDQPAGDPAGADQADGVDAEGDAVADLGEPDDVLVDERRRRDVGHHHGERQRADRDLAAVGADAERLPDPASGEASRCTARASGGWVSGTTSSTPTSIASAEPGDRPEHPAPAHRVGQQAPTSGASTGATPPTVSISVNALAAARPVTRSAITARPMTMPPAPGEALHEPAPRQHRQGRARARRPRRRPRRPSRSRRAAGAPEVVRQRAHDQLAERQPDQERGQRELHAAGAGAERRRPSPGSPGR